MTYHPDMDDTKHGIDPGFLYYGGPIESSDTGWINMGVVNSDGVVYEYRDERYTFHFEDMMRPIVTISTALDGDA
jgi:hypothetical protein